MLDVLIPVLLISTIIISFVLFLKNYFKTVYLAFKLKGPSALPFLGNVLLINDNYTLEYLGTNIYELYGPITRIWLSIIPFFVVYEPDHLQLILGTNKFTTKNMFYTLLHNFIGDGLITNTGKKWKFHRKLIQPNFHISVLKLYFNIFNKYSDLLIEEMEGSVLDINIVKLANRFVLNVLHEIVLGIPLKDENISPYRKGKIIMPYRITKPWLLIDPFFKRTDLSKIENEHKNILKSYTKKILDCKKISTNQSNSLIEMMLEISKNNPEFTENDVIDETCTFMLAGQDSVGSALVFSLYFLAAYQEIQTKVITEIDNIFQNNNNRPLTFDDITEMKYLEQCIKETLRLCPSVPMLARKVTKNLKLGNYLLPEGANILITPFATHRLPHIFPNPLKFDPDRFSAENKRKIHPFGYIPFSAGPRNCIGYKFAIIELKTSICHILRKYKVFLRPGYEKLNLSYRLTLKAKNGIWLRLEKRQI